MGQSGKDHSRCYQKFSHEVSGDGDRVTELLNPHANDKVAVKQSKLEAKAVAKDKSEGENMSTIV